MEDGTIDTSITVDDVTSSDNYSLSPQEALVFDNYNSLNRGRGDVAGVGDGTLNMNDYYPGYENGGHGTYSGSQVGNIPLFGGGGALVPMGMYDARDLALRRAALQKAKEVEDFRKAQKVPVSKLVNINDTLSNEYIDFQQKSWDRALKLSGGDPNKATYFLKNNPDYNKKTRSYENLARIGDDIVNKTAQDELDERSGKFTPTPRYKALRSKLYKAVNPSDPEFKNVADIYRTMQQERDFSDAVEQVTKRAFADERGMTGVDTNSDEFLKVYNNSVKEWSPDQVEGFARVLNDQFYQGSDYWTPERVKQGVKDMLRGKVSEKKLTVQQKKDNDGTDEYTVNDISSEPSSTNVYVRQTNAPDGTTRTEEGVITGDFGVTHKKQLDAVIPNGAHVYINDPSNGLLKSSAVSPNAKTKLFKTELIRVYDGSDKNLQGTPLSEKQISEKIPFKWEAMTKGVVTETDEDGNKVEKQIFVPSKEVENVLVKKRGKDGVTVEKGIPVDKLYQEADKRNANISQPQKSKLKINDVVSGYKFLGGDPNDAKNWKKQ